MDAFAVILSFLVISNVRTVLSQVDFAYDGPLGPQYWPELWPEQCAGKNQSPINILSEQTEAIGFEPVVLNGYGSDDIPGQASMQLTNTQHSVQISLDGDYHMEGGPLSSVYQLHQVHFHWGSKEDQGSEHMIDGKQYEAEIHLVHYDRENYDNFDEAVQNANGLSVFSVLIEVVEDNNEAFDPVVEALKYVTYPGNTYNFSEVFPVTSFLPSEENQDGYYFYLGSLTTPVCNEVVQWIVYKQPVYMSKEQIDVFRTTIYRESNSTKHIIDNFRPTQGLNGRLVYSADASFIQPSLMITTLGFALGVLLCKMRDS